MLRYAVIPGLFLCAFATAAHAQARCTAIRFAPGASSAIVKGFARNDAPFTCYTLTTRSGQTATIAIRTTGPNDDTAFTIPDVIDDQNKYSFKTEAKTYKIMVFLTFARQPDRPFSMRVSVK